jgi:hypothetical protein
VCNGADILVHCVVFDCLLCLLFLCDCCVGFVTFVLYELFVFCVVLCSVEVERVFYCIVCDPFSCFVMWFVRF